MNLPTELKEHGIRTFFDAETEYFVFKYIGMEEKVISKSELEKLLLECMVNYIKS